jgi:hypothetical protein
MEKLPSIFVNGKIEDTTHLRQFHPNAVLKYYMESSRSVDDHWLYLQHH